MEKDKLQDDYFKCKKIIEEHSKTFSIAFSGLPTHKKQAVWSLYAFNRRLDDIVDKTGSKSDLEKELVSFKDLEKGKVKQDYIYRTLHDVDEKFGLDYKAMEAMFTGQFQDLDFAEINTDEDLFDYCYNVAGSVGHMLLPVVATENKNILKKSARDLGIALQITNILRDVGEDYSIGRVYFPTQSLIKYKVDVKKIVHEKPSRNYIDMWEHYANIAEEFYKSGLEEIDLYDSDSKKPIWAASLIYKEILNSIRKGNYNLKKKAFVSKSVKIKLFTKLMKENIGNKQD